MADQIRETRETLGRCRALSPYSGRSTAFALLGLPGRAAAFWIAVVGAAAVLIGISGYLASANQQFALAALLFLAGVAAAEQFNVRLPSSRPGALVNVSVAGAICVAVVLLFPTQWAVLIAGFGLMTGELARGQRELRKVVFNGANLSLSVALASAVWRFGEPASGLDTLASVPWVLLAAGTFLIVNTLITTSIVAFVLGVPVGMVWWRGHRHILLANLGLHAIGIPIAGLWLAYPWMLVCLGVALLALRRAIDDRVKLETQTLESLFKLADILDDRDKYTHGHSERVGHYAEQLAIQLGLPSERAHLAFLAGRLHDIGKCAVNNEVLRKPGDLDDCERDHMRQHPAVGSAMLAHFSLFQEVAQFVRGHHERWDGAGYPDGLRGGAIPLESRIISVVDSYDAMTTTRPYRSALPQIEAVRRLRDGADRQWDPRVVAAFIEWLDQRAQMPSTATASSAPGHGGVVAITSSSGTAPVLRN